MRAGGGQSGGEWGKKANVRQVKNIEKTRLGIVEYTESISMNE